MKDTMDKLLRLGLGLVAAGKEQIEKTVEELVEKGELSRAESKAVVDEWLKKGEDTKQHIERLIQERLDALIQQANLATKGEIARLEQRIAELEEKLADRSSDESAQ
ncbi:hypothetical protein PRECH8_09030 [Insulibacter thermoxylanivorax]|uniref:Polyhydroxyalkanoate synthesis regulator phasin n=1 Tax=Insulibacter thermoxylanivorax TaxID=2749268 RepID=A0A916QBC6_9BACL|nr:hypothetical protein [Insulibacter thermoxylanivorax]GFR37607.1 hypothetical protein PRECH8_09030 [Insulibacter thermoxylanivorax]